MSSSPRSPSCPTDVPDEVRARLLANLSRAYMRTDRFERAVEVADQALPIAERLELTSRHRGRLQQQGLGLSYLGGPRGDARSWRRRSSVAHASGNSRPSCAPGATWRARSGRVDPRRAIAMQAENYELARRVGNRQMANWIIQSLVAGVWLSGGDWDARPGARPPRRSRPPGTCPRRRASSRAMASSGSPVVTRRTMRLQTLELAADQLSDPIHPAQLHCLKGDRALVRGDYADGFEGDDGRGRVPRPRRAST